MLSVRPAASPHHLVRPRLLDLLPDQKGFVVWLEAPYGYGKSVLASQWARQLESRDWRVIWLSLAQRDADAAIAHQLDLPAGAPWGVLLDTLWSVPTLLVLEELSGAEDLQPLLKHVGGLLLLASRQHLPYPPLAQLATTDRLTHVTASALAFTQSEASELFSDQQRAAEAVRTTNGWPLPLHFAALADALPANATLLEGVKRSVSQAAWRELLFTTALVQLPKAAAVDATHELVRAGFLQKLGDAYRLHPLVADGALKRHTQAVHAELEAGAKRLTPAQLGAAFEHAAHLTALAELITAPHNGLQTVQPTDYLRWNGLVPDHSSPRRAAYVAEALLLLNRYDEALPDVDRLLDDERLSTAERTLLTAVTVYALSAAKRFEQCAPYAQRLRAMLPHEDPTVMGRAQAHLAHLAYMQGDYAQADATLKELLSTYARLEPGPQRQLLETKARISTYTLAWEIHGALEEQRFGLLDMLEKGGLDQTANLTVRQNSAVNLTLTWELEAASRLLREALKYAAPYHRLIIEAMLAFTESAPERFPALLSAARRWEQLELSERVSALWLRTLRFSGDLLTGRQLYDDLQQGPYTKLEQLWLEAAAGNRDAALNLLEDTRGAYPYREYALHWHAARLLLTPTEEALADLFTLVQLSQGHGRILRFVGLKLEHLPRHRPELARYYPLDEVLASGWAEAIQQRLADIPPLEVRLHGEFGVRLLGRTLQLTERQQQLLALLVVGRSRETIGEALWPEADPAKQRNNLGVQLNVLRKALEPWGVTTYLHRDGLRNVRSDHLELVRALEAGDAKAVLALLQEPLFASLDVEELSEAGYQLRERGLELLLAAGTAASDDSSLKFLKRALELDPLHEEALQALLTRLRARGRGREARQVYERFATRLAQETGLQPEPGTTALVTAAR